MKDDPKIDFVADFYSEAYGDRQADFLTCKMTLEHVIDTGRFIRNVREAIADRLDTTGLLPDPQRSLRAGRSRRSGTCTTNTARTSPTARWRVSSAANVSTSPTCGPTTTTSTWWSPLARRPSRPHHGSLRRTTSTSGREVAHFAEDVPRRFENGSRRPERTDAAGRTVVLWGGGSKGVAFLTTLGLSAEIAPSSTSIRTRRAPSWPGTGHRIVAPDSLTEIRPDVVIVMNPIYPDEISADLAALGLRPEMPPVE